MLSFLFLSDDDIPLLLRINGFHLQQDGTFDRLLQQLELLQQAIERPILLEVESVYTQEQWDVIIA